MDLFLFQHFEAKTKFLFFPQPIPATLPQNQEARYVTSGLWTYTQVVDKVRKTRLRALPSFLDPVSLDISNACAATEHPGASRNLIKEAQSGGWGPTANHTNKLGNLDFNMYSVENSGY